MNAVFAALRSILSAIAEQFRLGISIFWIGPLVAALVVVPEFAQHVAEIYLGMFDGREAAIAASQDPLRMGFGYVKIAGLVLTFIASARFWWCRTHGGRWYDVRQIAWGRLVMGFVLFMGIGSLSELHAPLTGNEAPLWMIIAASVASLPFLFVMLAGLFGDRVITWKTLVLKSWRWLLLLALLLVLCYAPLFWLHGMNHKWAMGAPDAAIWVLMIFDALVVGAMATLVGAALFVCYDRFVRTQK